MKLRDNKSTAITVTLESMTTCSVEFIGTTKDSSFKVITSRIKHVIGGIMRMKIIIDYY